MTDDEPGADGEAGAERPPTASAALPDGLGEPAAIEAGRLLFANACTFMLSVVGLDQLPPSTRPEIAFCGRSNVGKSSLINALVGQHDLARASNTPGRTQALNYFDLGGRMTIVDLPGYGYAKAPKAAVERWTALTRDFLRGRVSLARLCVLIDSRHGLKPNDEELMTLLDRSAVNYQLVLTKIDKLKRGAVAGVLAETSARAGSHVACHPIVLATSAEKGTGLPELRSMLTALAEP